MPRRTFWLVAGVAIGAGSSLWMEHKVRRTVNQAAARLQPDALVAEVGRSAREAAIGAGDRFRDALSSGRSEMLRREEELWSELASRPAPASAAPPPLLERFAADTRPELEPDPELGRRSTGRSGTRRHRGIRPTWATRGSTSHAAT